MLLTSIWGSPGSSYPKVHVSLVLGDSLLGLILTMRKTIDEERKENVLALISHIHLNAACHGKGTQNWNKACLDRMLGKGVNSSKNSEKTLPRSRVYPKDTSTNCSV